jgi:hypothetical protein
MGGDACVALVPPPPVLSPLLIPKEFQIYPKNLPIYIHMRKQVSAQDTRLLYSQLHQALRDFLSVRLFEASFIQLGV